MSDLPDPLRQEKHWADRVQYATGVLLDARDFGDEQTYHRRQLARALAYLHGSGTSAGLTVRWEAAVPAVNGAPAQEEQLLVEPGLAVDRLGRLIELPRSACIRLGKWYNEQPADDLIQGLHPAGVIVDLFIRFEVCERGKTPALAAGPFDALDAVVASRLRDGYHLSLIIRHEDNPLLPASPWPVNTGDVSDLHNAILNAWQNGSADWDEFGLVPRQEHATGQDTTDVFLARLTLPAMAAPNPTEPPVRTAGADVFVDNLSRQFVYTPQALARWLGV